MPQNIFCAQCQHFLLMSQSGHYKVLEVSNIWILTKVEPKHMQQWMEEVKGQNVQIQLSSSYYCMHL